MATLGDLRKERLRRAAETAGPAGAPASIRPTANPPQAQLSSDVDVVGDLRRGVRPAMIAAGATLGAVGGGGAGLLTGPGAPAAAPAGFLGGAMLGAAGGSLAFDNLNDALQFFDLEPLPGGTEASGTELDVLAARTSRAGREATTEGIFTGGFSLVFPVKRFLTPLVGKIFGTRTDAARAVAAAAERQGVKLGAVDVGNVVTRGFAKVLGIFPFTGAPLRRGRLVKEGQITRKVAEILNEVAPTSTMAGEMGIDLQKAAIKSHKKFRSTAALLYDKFRTAARNIKDADGKAVPVIPTDETRQMIKQFADEFRLGTIPLKTAGDDVQVLKGGLSEEFEAFLKSSEKIPDRLTYDQYIQLQSRLEGFIDEIRPNAFNVKRVAQIKQSMEVDLQDIGRGVEDLIDSATLENLRRLKGDADTFFAGGIVPFQTTTAAKFAKVDRRIFEAGAERAGSINPDELLKPVFNADSAIALKDLREIVGEKAFRRAARTHLDDAVSKSFSAETRNAEKVQVFDLEKFAGNLGLVSGMKDRTDALKVMLEGTDVSVKSLKEFLDVARVAKISDPSSFVVRRATLGGVAALSAVAGAGGGLAATPATAIAITLLSRHTSKVLASSRSLKALTASLKPELDEVKRRALLLRLARQLGEQEEDQPQVKALRRIGGEFRSDLGLNRPLNIPSR